MGKPAYVGLDINETSINWCQKHIAPLFPDVVFGWMDVYNPFYNPKGTQTPSAYRFPFPDGSFDFIFLTSVFTHMRPDGAINYLREINRLLRDGGRCFTTYFILNETSRQLILENKGTNLFIYGTKLNIPSFPCRFDGFYAEETEVPEKIIAFDESDVRSLHEAAGLPISGEIHYGCWCGRENYTSYQDIVIAEKKKGNIHHSVGIH